MHNLQVYIHKPVVATGIIIHLASDGRSLKRQDKNHLHIQLISVDDTYVNLEHSNVAVSCEESPLHVPITQDLSKPFVLTKGKTH